MEPEAKAELVRQLQQRLDELDRESSGSAESRRPVELDQQSVGRLSRMDAMQVQAMAQAAEQRRGIERQRILATLDRIAQDRFGLCARCEEEIEPARLALDATTPLCLACARR
ncbi:molecular chaperone DnaK [Allostella sp. ATCC 35155]|nr:molecular chaperone DnaK [Stella sp. ATCC 35155]